MRVGEQNPGCTVSHSTTKPNTELRPLGFQSTECLIDSWVKWISFAWLTILGPESRDGRSTASAAKQMSKNNRELHWQWVWQINEMIFVLLVVIFTGKDNSNLLNIIFLMNNFWPLKSFSVILHWPFTQHNSRATHTFLQSTKVFYLLPQSAWVSCPFTEKTGMHKLRYITYCL